MVNFSSSSSSVSKGETLIDTVNNILAMKVDMVVIRHPKPGAAVFLARHVNSIVINAGDGTHEHPTQALLDAYSIKEKLGAVKGVKVAIVGDIMHSRVALSNIFCLQKLGAEVMVCGPATLIPSYIKELGVKVELYLRKALLWCDVVNMLRIHCYSPITATTASWLTAVYQYDSAGRKMVLAANGGNPVGATAIEAASVSSGNFRQMGTWFNTLMGDSFG